MTLRVRVWGEEEESVKETEKRGRGKPWGPGEPWGPGKKGLMKGEISEAVMAQVR